MKPQKIHIKIFSVSLLILVVVEILAFLLLNSIAVKYIHTTAFKYLAYRSEGFKHVLENEVRIAGTDYFSEDQDLQAFLKNLEQLYKAKFCILSPNGKKTICSSAISTPVIPEKDLKRYKNFFYKELRGNEKLLFYMQIPITFPNDKEGAVIAIFDRSKVRIVSAAEKLLVLLFSLYLLGIGVGTAFLLFPVSRFITNPIRMLRDSANKIAGGDLTHRVTTRSNDEIGDLGNAFNQMADSVEQMVDGTKELSANISHELRSPLSRIRIAQEILRDRVSAANHSYIDDIENEIEEMDSLISRILLISKLDSQKLSRKRELVDIPRVTTDLLERYTSAMQQKSINLMIRIPESSPSIYANHNDIRMAMSNLLDNAIKYTPDNGNIEIKIITDKNHIELFIANTCEKETQIKFNKLFEPFYRPAGNKIAGTGLGLTITKKIIESYQGKITSMPWGTNGIKLSIKFNI